MTMRRGCFLTLVRLSIDEPEPPIQNSPRQIAPLFPPRVLSQIQRYVADRETFQSVAHSSLSLSRWVARAKATQLARLKKFERRSHRDIAALTRSPLSLPPSPLLFVISSSLQHLPR
jgi:hypothetical protein